MFNKEREKIKDRKNILFMATEEHAISNKTNKLNMIT